MGKKKGKELEAEIVPNAELRNNKCGYNKLTDHVYIGASVYKNSGLLFIYFSTLRFCFHFIAIRWASL